jgi:predicted metalloprotease with PDZ domain
MINSGWKKSLDDLMRDLLKRTQNESLVVSNGSLIALIRFYAGEAPLADIMRVLNSGTILRVNPDALGSAFNIEQNSRRKFWLFGELYEIPIYIAKDPDHLANKDLLLWFGIQ